MIELEDLEVIVLFFSNNYRALPSNNFGNLCRKKRIKMILWSERIKKYKKQAALLDEDIWCNICLLYTSDAADE